MQNVCSLVSKTKKWRVAKRPLNNVAVDTSWRLHEILLGNSLPKMWGIGVYLDFTDRELCFAFAVIWLDLNTI